ncbi:MAG: ATP synthase F0 subunit B [Candidatus Magnetominusculus sp. LBB02]|nr:ATP synthase F0 subunit B [Candidatus Magnetominusculus sp. LBB02]
MSKTTKTLIIAFIAAMFSAALAYASEEGGAGHGSHLKEWFWLVVNFLILVGVLGFFLKQPLVSYFKERTQLLQSALSEAQEAKSLAEKALNEIEHKLKFKDEEIRKILEEAAKTAEAARDGLIADGKEASAAIEKLTSENIAYELKKAKQLIRQKAAAAALELATDKIMKSMNSDMAEKLINDSIAKIDKGGVN